jgi:hypothetical protein
MAMTTIKATCPTCGEVELTADDLTLMVCSQAPLSYYAFRCPRCIEEIRKPADDHIISLLVSGGVRATSWTIPAEALEEHDGSPSRSSAPTTSRHSPSTRFAPELLLLGLTSPPSLHFPSRRSRIPRRGVM